MNSLVTKLDTAACSAKKSDVILHAFDWSYRYIAKQAEQISRLGYGTILVSPAMKSLKRDGGTDWWQRYQPQDYRVIDNQLGNTDDFIAMIQALKAAGVKVYADVVFNHMANESQIREDLQYPSPKDMQDYKDNLSDYQSIALYGDLSEPLFTEDDFVEAFGIEDWKDKWQVQNGRINCGREDPGLPTLRDNEHVIQQQKNYLMALKEMGVCGFRIDAAKHITLEHLNKVWTDDIMQGVHIFGEIITDGGATKQEYETFLQPYLEETELGAYDFPLFNTVFQALQCSGSMTSLIDPYCFGQALSNERAVTFAITHDIPNNDAFNGLIMGEENEWLAHAYILGRDGGVPLIYSDLDPSGIIGSNQQPRWQNMWQDPRMVAMIAFHNQMHGEAMHRLVGDEDFLVFSRGDKGIVAMNKSTHPVHISIDWQKSMVDILDGKKYQSEYGDFCFTLPPCSYLMLVAEQGEYEYAG